MGDYSRSVGISGSHGKSTVTAMLYHILGELGESPAVLEGAALYEVIAKWEMSDKTYSGEVHYAFRIE